MVGPPGSGKSMLAARLPSILPPLSPRELLEVSMVASIAGELAGGKLSERRPFRAPHHSASMAAMVGGGTRARPGEVSLAHNGILFLDELPEFHPAVLDSLRQPLENGECVIARANHRVTYPGAHPADHGDESVPLRHGRRARPSLRARAALRHRLPVTSLRPLAGPDRHEDRSAGRDRVGSDRAGAGGEFGRRSPSVSHRRGRYRTSGSPRSVFRRRRPTRPAPHPSSNGPRIATRPPERCCRTRRRRCCCRRADTIAC